MGECILARTSSAIGGKDYIEGTMTMTGGSAMTLAFDAEVADGDSYSFLIQGRFGDSAKAFTLSGQITYNSMNGKFTNGYILTTQFYTTTISGYALGGCTSGKTSGNHHEANFQMVSVKTNNYVVQFDNYTVLDITMCRLYKVQ